MTANNQAHISAIMVTIAEKIAYNSNLCFCYNCKTYTNGKILILLFILEYVLGVICDFFNKYMIDK